MLTHVPENINKIETARILKRNIGGVRATRHRQATIQKIESDMTSIDEHRRVHTIYGQH